MENQLDKRAELLEIAKNTSHRPGVYLMKSTDGTVLYVGKAKNLKNRITTYFQAAEHERLRTELMVRSVHIFDCVLTETENEALILENTLIKRYKPKYNVRLKDDKAYPYLKVRVDQEYPRLEWTRKPRKDGARYFGPFTSALAAREVMQLLNQVYRLRDCSDNTFAHRSRPCILFQMDRCTAPCVKNITADDYQLQVSDAVKILEGKSDALVAQLKTEMGRAAEGENFEEAARVRDQIQSIEIVTSVQGVVEPGTERDRDVLGIARQGTDGNQSEAQGVVLHVRGGKLISIRHYQFQNIEESVSDAEAMGQFLTHHYGQGETVDSEKGLVAPKDILVSIVPDELEFIEKALGLPIVQPASPAEEQLVKVAVTNAQYALEQLLKKAQGHGFGALEDVMEKLHLTRIPRRIECFDISNIQDSDAVASRVVFVDGAPDKNLYRKYKIREVEGQNDFAMMKEVLGRRFSKVDEALPDLVVIDGGKGQLAQALAIFEELNIQGVEVVGLAKARTESDFKSTEVKMTMERVFLPGRSNPVSLKPGTQIHRILTHIRDEAHRFAISYHRQVRSKRVLGK